MFSLGTWLNYIKIIILYSPWFLFKIYPLLYTSYVMVILAEFLCFVQQTWEKLAEAVSKVRRVGWFRDSQSWRMLTSLFSCPSKLKIFWWCISVRHRLLKKTWVMHWDNSSLRSKTCVHSKKSFGVRTGSGKRAESQALAMENQ